MSRSRTEQRKRKRANRRIKLFILHLFVWVGVGGVIAWNVWASSSAGEAGRLPPLTATEEGAGQENGLPMEREEVGREPSETNSVPAASKEEPEPELPVSKETVSLAFVGDVLLGEYVGTLLRQNGFDYPYVHVSDRLQKADIAVANLETAVTALEGEKPGKKTYEFRSDPEALPAFREAGFDLVSLANNHTLDFGPDGLRDTMKHLEKNGIRHVGAGETADDAYSPAYIEKNGLRIAVFSFSRVIPDVSWKVGTNKIGLAETYDYRRPVEEIGKAAEEADLVVVLAHWGDERTQEPHPEKQVDLGRRYIDAGADLVIGSHPHIIQGFEHYNGGWIAYSMGNFIFTKSKDELTYDAGILEAECGKDGECRLQLTPFRADTPQPQPMAPERSEAVLARISSLSVGATIGSNGEVIPNGMER